MQTIQKQPMRTFLLFAVIAVLLAAAVKSSLAAAPGQDYPFREAYPFAHLVHSVLSVPQTRVRYGKTFDVDISIYNDSGMNAFYNVAWNRLLRLPGRLALYDSRKHYICDLLEYTEGSHVKGRVQGDWMIIQEPGYAGTTVSVSLPSTPNPHVTTGTYYLQVIYFPKTVQTPSEKPEPFGPDNQESFRSNAVKITVVN